MRFVVVFAILGYVKRTPIPGTLNRSCESSTAMPIQWRLRESLSTARVRRSLAPASTRPSPRYAVTASDVLPMTCRAGVSIKPLSGTVRLTGLLFSLRPFTASKVVSQSFRAKICVLIAVASMVCKFTLSRAEKSSSWPTKTKLDVERTVWRTMQPGRASLLLRPIQFFERRRLR